MACIVALFSWGSGSSDLVYALLDGTIHVVSKMINLLLTVKVSSNNVICLDKGIKFSL